MHTVRRNFNLIKRPLRRLLKNAKSAERSDSLVPSRWECAKYENKFSAAVRQNEQGCAALRQFVGTSEPRVVLAFEKQRRWKGAGEHSRSMNKWGIHKDANEPTLLVFNSPEMSALNKITAFAPFRVAEWANCQRNLQILNVWMKKCRRQPLQLIFYILYTYSIGVK